MRKRLLYILFLILTASGLRAQVVIPDDNFRQFLKNTYPSVIMANQKLDTTAAKAVTGSFECDRQGVVNPEGLQYFINVNGLHFAANKLTTFPNISRLTKIVELAVDSNQLVSLPDLSKCIKLKVIVCSVNKLKSLPAVNGLPELQTLFAESNELTQLPALTGLTKLKFLYVSRNKLTSLPDMSTLTALEIFFCPVNQITVIPDLTNSVNLNSLYFGANAVTRFPDITGLSNLQRLSAYYNQLDSLPDASNFPNLVHVTVGNNNIKLRHLVSYGKHPNHATSFYLTPQNVGIAQNFKRQQKQSLTLTADYHDQVTGLVYHWYKNNTLVGSGTTDTYTINTIALTDSGSYTYRVTTTSPGLESVNMISKVYRVDVTPCVITNNLSIQIKQEECKYPIEMDLDESSLVGGQPPFKYTVKNQTKTYNFTTPVFYVQQEGKYDLLITDALGCEVDVPDRINIPRSANCDPVFYPNGDGIADTYYIEETGTARIYDRENRLIRELSSPAQWDGLDKNGQEARTGLYVIVVNGNVKIRVTLLR